MYRLATILLAAAVITSTGCNETELTAPPPEIDNLARSKHKPGHGGGPGGGNPREPTPPGVIYAYVGGGNNVEMDADGTVLRTLDAAARGIPTHATHGGELWFVYAEEVAGVYPDSTQRQDLFAVSESGTVVQLTNDPLFHPMNQPRWSPAPADGEIVFRGRRFSSAIAAADEGGLYVAEVTFAGGAPSVTSYTLHITGTMVQDTTRCTTNGICYATPNVIRADWSPDARRLLYTIRDLPASESGLDTETSIFVYEADGSSTFVTSPGNNPRWSSLDMVVFYDYTVVMSNFTMRLWTIDLDGTKLTQVEEIRDRGQGANANNWTYARFRGHEWSPDGNHIVYGILDCKLVTNSSCDNRIIRRKADGSGEKVIATPSWVDVQGWR